MFLCIIGRSKGIKSILLEINPLLTVEGALNIQFYYASSSNLTAIFTYELIMSTFVHLDAEYRLTRAALLNAGIEMTDSIDALYRDWRRWRDLSATRALVDHRRVANVDLWWAHHLAQFQSMIQPVQVAARAERARKQRIADRARTQLAGKQHSPRVGATHSPERPPVHTPPSL